MAVENLTLLNIVNQVYIGIRENEISSLSGTQKIRTKQIVQAIKDVYDEVCSLGDGHWKFLEADGSITLATSDRDYTQATDLKDLNKESFLINDEKKITYVDYNTFLEKYPDTDKEGDVYHITEWNDEFLVGYVPNATLNGYTIKYKYWKQWDDLMNDGDYPLIPKEFRRRILVFGAISQIFFTDGNPAYRSYQERYLAGISDLKKTYGSIKPREVRVTHVF